MEQTSLKKNAFYSVLRVFLSLIFPLITFPYVSRILLPEGIGKVNFANSIIGYFIIIASLGISSYATREAVKIRNDKTKLTKFFKEIITINLFCCFIAYILFFISLFLIPKFSDYRNLLLICSIKIFFSVVGIDWIYTANEEFKFITIRTFIIQLFSIIYLFIFVHSKNDIIHYAVFTNFVIIGTNFINFFFVGKYINIKEKTSLEIKKHFKPIFLFFGISFVTSIYTLFDTTMLGFFSTDTEVGFYTASTKIGHLVLSLLTAITTVLLPRLTDYVQKEETDKFEELINHSSNFLLLFAIPMTFGIAILAKPLIILISGENYLPSVPSMQIISPIIIFISFGSLVGVQILPAMGKEKISFYSYLAGASFNLFLNFLLIPKYGSIGAAVGTVTAEFIVTFIQVIYIRKLLITKELIKNFFQCLFASIIMIIIIYFYQRVFSNIILILLTSVFLGIIIYSILLFIIKNKFFLFYANKLLLWLKKK